MIPKFLPVCCHTDNVGPGSTFVAISGFKEKGSTYIPQALARGATCIVVEEHEILSPEVETLIIHHSAQLIRVTNARSALAQLSAQAWGNAHKKLKIIGITGTKGKTTTAFLVEHILVTAGFTTALLSTVKNKILDTDLPTILTTQQPDYLHAFFYQCVNAGVEYVVMEVAAQALTLHRVYGLEFCAIIFTNFSQEHAEFYTSLDDYFAAKISLLEHAAHGAPILLNADDPRIAQLANSLTSTLPAHPERSRRVKRVNIHFFSTKNARAIMCKNNLNFTITYNNNSLTITCPALIGSFNVSNLLAALTLAELFSISSDAVTRACATFPGVPGRLNIYNLPNGARACIDYAHNPASFDAVLSTMRELTDHLIVIFGCGGERDATKRPLMGACAARYADLIIITSDNPRSENPAMIAQEIISGIAQEHMHKIILELDRATAIKKAYSHARAGSVIMLLGKGPDEYQLINGIKYPFSEREILKTL